MAENSHPRRKHIRLPLQDYCNQYAWFFVTICCRGKLPLLSPRARDVVVNALRQTARELHVELAIYCVLPDHLHFIGSGGAKGMVAFVQAFKSHAAVMLSRTVGMPSPWQTRFFDHKLRSSESLRRKCEYVWLNPVRKKLVRSAEDWAWTGQLLTD